jgi:mannose-6-phosphate isomerase-like protein (cupin superfamily)
MSGLRRVVTGHDASGRAVVSIDEISTNSMSRRPGQTGTVIWTTPAVPADNTDDADGALAKVDNTLPNGTVFRVVRYEPGVAPRVHRTDSIDYAVVVSGEIDMELDNGVSVHFRAGDLLVQRGTVHNWINRGTEPCIVAFILIAAHPLGLPPV